MLDRRTPHLPTQVGQLKAPPATAPECLLRPVRRNGVVVRPSRDQARAIRDDERNRMARANQGYQRPPKTTETMATVTVASRAPTPSRQ